MLTLVKFFKSFIVVPTSFINSFMNFTATHKGAFILAIINGISIGVVAEYLGWKVASVNMLFLLLVFVIVDAASGLVATRYNKEKITSRKGFRTVWKIIAYFLFFHTIVQLGQYPLIKESAMLSSMLGYFELIVLCLAILWEMHSWGENLEDIYGKKFKLFSFMEKLAEILETLVFSKINKISNLEIKDKKIQKK